MTAPGLTYFKRYQMQLDLLAPLPPAPPLPDGYAWMPWEEWLLEAHAEVKFQCFAQELDGVVFPNLSNPEGCLRLMREIRRRPGFVRQATWLLAHGDDFVG